MRSPGIIRRQFGFMHKPDRPDKIVTRPYKRNRAYPCNIRTNLEVTGLRYFWTADSMRIQVENGSVRKQFIKSYIDSAKELQARSNEMFEYLSYERYKTPYRILPRVFENFRICGEI